LSREDLTQVEGVVSERLAADHFSIALANGQSIRARASGKLRRMHIRVAVGDRVTVGISPYDVSHGLILSRAKLPPRPTG
jgi:translation initiation factor IF-1